MVVVVGAEKSGDSEFVYYIDPQDESDPKAPEKQRILIMRYQFLTENICDNLGLLGRDSPPTIGYGYRRSFPSQ